MHPSLRTLLVCPVCRGPLTFAPALIRCTGCGRVFPQAGEHIDLLPRDRLAGDGTRWDKRQRLCDQWYSDLCGEPERASFAMEQDYAPHAAALASLTGRILDVGGGVGIARHYLSSGATYVSLEPSPAWLDTSWSELTDRFPCLSAPPCFVRGVGEFLPFAAGSFEAVLSFWSLNHVLRPDAVVREMARVLVPSGRALIVLEDMIPTWRDLFQLRRLPDGGGRRFLRHKIAHAVLGRAWPVQDDHLEVAEGDLATWISGLFAVDRRAWVGQYLRYELTRC